MHIPDGFMDLKTATATGTLAAIGLGAALRCARVSLPARHIPLLGLSAAFVFAAQMLNFPVIAGTSGHLMGAALTAALLGPAAAIIVISAVLIVQCFLFADGGITALGANIFNMAVVGGVVGWSAYESLRRTLKGTTGCVVGGFVAGWVSTVLASIVCTGELAAANTVGWSVALPAMAGVHALIGIGEGIITAMVLISIAKARPDLLSADRSHAQRKEWGTILILGLIISLGLAAFVAPFACPWPDGLERTAAVLGFADNASAEASGVPAPIPDYAMPGITSEAIATAMAGIAGTIAVFAIAWMLAKALLARRGDDDQPEPAAVPQ